VDKLSYSSWKLEFKHYPIDRWVWAAALLLNLLWIVTVIKNTTLICSRSEAEQGTCKVLLKTLIQPQAREIREFPIAALEKARLDWQSSSRDNRIYLRFNDGQELLVLSREKIKGSLQTEASQINAFINSNTKPSLVIENGVKDFQIFYFILSMQIGFILFLLIFNGSVLLASFDRSSQQFTLRRLGLWRRPPLIYEFAEISTVELEVNQPGVGRKGSYRLNVVLTSHQEIPLTTTRLFSESNRRSLQASCDRINQFLKS
jgi:hypothetical protein